MGSDAAVAEDDVGVTREEKPLLGVTLGDPCGIGPEVLLRALASRRARAVARFLVFGSERILDRVACTLRLRRPRWVPLGAGESPDDRAGPFLRDAVKCPVGLAMKGRATAAGGRASIAWITAAIDAALEGTILGIVTAPINKVAVHKAGYDWPGHTELLAARTGAKKPVMTMVGGGLRAALVTTHLSIRDLPRAVTQKNVLDTIRIVHRDMRRYFGFARPRIAVCGLNPHAGESGRFGEEERRAIRPAVRRACSEGIRCDGPTPADIVFTKGHLARHDAVVAMYHDQANIPVKMAAFDKGVNVTLGLPIIRTSPDHGTAYDIVRKGTANPGSFIEAIRLAAHMASRRRRR